MFHLSSRFYNNSKKTVASHIIFCAFCAFTALPLSGCANSGDSKIFDSGNVIYDPYEEYNRTVTKFNQALDHTIINPAIKGYRIVTPEPARDGLQNFMKNLRTPVNLLNQLLQGDMQGAHDVIIRAIVNTTVGMGGIFDVAAYEGIPYEAEDFGQTLAVWGVNDGPYIVIPFFGSSTLRDYGGMFADTLTDPIYWYAHNVDKKWISHTKTGINYFLVRESLYDSMYDVERNSFDYYAALRSTYYQYRKAAILDLKNGRANENRYDDMPEIPDFDDY